MAATMEHCLTYRCFGKRLKRYLVPPDFKECCIRYSWKLFKFDKKYQKTILSVNSEVLVHWHLKNVENPALYLLPISQLTEKSLWSWIIHHKCDWLWLNLKELLFALILYSNGRENYFKLFMIPYLDRTWKNVVKYHLFLFLWPTNKSEF